MIWIEKLLLSQKMQWEKSDKVRVKLWNCRFNLMITLSYWYKFVFKWASIHTGDRPPSCAVMLLLSQAWFLPTNNPLLVLTNHNYQLSLIPLDSILIPKSSTPKPSLPQSNSSTPLNLTSPGATMWEDIPLHAFKILQFIKQQAQGLFRVAGKTSRQKNLRQRHIWVERVQSSEPW